MNLRLLAFGAIAALAAVPVLLASSRPAEAGHSWGSYHWARTNNPFNLKIGDNVSSAWDGYLDTTIGDWSSPGTSGWQDALNLTKEAGQANPKNCRATSGRVEVCNSKYGNNGWLGLAQIWISGSHITQGLAKLNDSYFNTSTYDTTAWRNMVSCQEVGHTFGLGHQDEGFDNTNLGTCMDYSRYPGGNTSGIWGALSNAHPNAHDFEQLETIYYNHIENSTTLGAATASGPGRSGSTADEGPNNPADFGRPTGSKDGLGRDDLFVKTLADGRMLFTHVFWALPK